MSSTKSRGRLGPLVTGVTVTCLVLLGVVYYAPGSDSPRGRVLIDLPLGRSFGSHGSNGQVHHEGTNSPTIQSQAAFHIVQRLSFAVWSL